jgi:hypothetical protein
MPRSGATGHAADIECAAAEKSLWSSPAGAAFRAAAAGRACEAQSKPDPIEVRAVGPSSWKSASGSLYGTAMAFKHACPCGMFAAAADTAQTEGLPNAVEFKMTDGSYFTRSAGGM